MTDSGESVVDELRMGETIEHHKLCGPFFAEIKRTEKGYELYECDEDTFHEGRGPSGIFKTLEEARKEYDSYT